MKKLLIVLIIGVALTFFSANHAQAYELVDVDPAQRAVDYTEKVIKAKYPDAEVDADNARVRIWMDNSSQGSIIFEVTMDFTVRHPTGSFQWDAKIRDGGTIVQRACVFDTIQIPVISYGNAITWNKP